MTRPRLLDLFCGAGGAAVGYDRVGFEVVGVDIRLQPRYPFHFVRGDALRMLRCPAFFAAFDAIHASPPCQVHTSMKVMWNAREHRDLIARTRARLQAIGLPYVIENVPGAPLCNPVTLCGASLGLRTASYDLARHRLFEASFPMLVPPCAHGARPVLGVYGDHARDRRRVPGTHHDPGLQLPAGEGLAAAREIMGMPWANWRELSQAIPPAYTEFIGHELMRHVQTQRDATVREPETSAQASEGQHAA